MEEIQSEITNFSDVMQQTQPLEGDIIPVRDIVDKTIIVRDFKTVADKFAKPDEVGKLVTIIQYTFEDETEKKISFTRSGVLLKQLDVMKEHLPFKAQIIRKKTYLTFK